MVLILQQFRRNFVWLTRTSYFRWKKAILFGLLCYIFFKFYCSIPVMSTATIAAATTTTTLRTTTTTTPKWTSCSQYKDIRMITDVSIPHFECEISNNNPKPGILNLLQYVKPQWDIKKVIHIY